MAEAQSLKYRRLCRDAVPPHPYLFRRMPADPLQPPRGGRTDSIDQYVLGMKKDEG